MRKGLLLLVVLMLNIGAFSFSQEIAIALSGTEGNYRVPVIGDFAIFRIDCDDHYGTGRYMDINLGGEADNGAPIYSSGNGSVASVGYVGDYGNNVVVENGEVNFRYAHLSKIYVSQGQQVYKGDLIGLIGNTGKSHGSHLHWEAWGVNGNGFELMSIPGISIDVDAAGPGQICTNDGSDGTISGPSRFRWDDCPSFYNEAVADNFPYVVLFDHKDCRGNAMVLTWESYAGWDLTNHFDDRTRSIFVPPGKSVIVSPGASNPSNAYRCSSIDMWNLDSDFYSDGTSAGWVGGPGDNLVSFVTVYPFECPANPRDVILSASPNVASDVNNHIAVGSYTIPKMDASNSIPFTIQPGWRMEEVAAAIDNTAGLSFSGGDFLSTVRAGVVVDPAFARLVGLPAGASLEGFLYPGDYQVSPGITTIELRDLLIQRFVSVIDAQLLQDTSNHVLTFYEVVTLASIVERESLHTDEQPLIASVYLNRLEYEIKLDSVPTVQYALNGNRGRWWPQIIQTDQQAVVSDYNTYRRYGLPPGPIANPSLGAIQAVLYPAESNYFYFRDTCNGDGYHNFSAKYQEYLATECSN